MPTYEMPLLIRIMKKPELVETLKRTTASIFNTGGFIRKMENWGVKQLPCKTSCHGQVYREANHFLIYFDAPPRTVNQLLDEYSRDIDIVRLKIFKQEKRVPKECTFHEEMLPAAFRPSIHKLLDEAKKQRNRKYDFKYNSGLDYYPFTR